MTLHQIWIGDALPTREARWVETVRTAAAASGVAWRLWSFADLLSTFAGEEATEICRAAWQAMPCKTTAGLISDYFRLRVLGCFGGLYLDCDFQCCTPTLPSFGGYSADLLLLPPPNRGPMVGNGFLLARTARAAQALADAAAVRLSALLGSPSDPLFAPRLVGVMRKTSGKDGIAVHGVGGYWLNGDALPQLRANGYTTDTASEDVAGHAEWRGTCAPLLHMAGGAWREIGAALWEDRQRAAARALPHDLLVLVCSCHGYTDRQQRYKTAEECAEQRQACRRTWLRDLPDGVSYAFFAGRGAADEADLWQLDAPDTYAELPAKVHAAFCRALELPGWAYLFKCDDDSFVSLPRLKKMVDAQDGSARIVSWHGVVKPHTAHGGAGYLLPRELVAAIVADPAMPTRGAEDREVHAAALRAGAAAVFDGRFCPNMRHVPRLNNEQISAHWCSPADMLAIYNGELFQAARRQAMPRPQQQSRRPLPLLRVNGAPRLMQPQPDGLIIPRDCKRIVVLSNCRGVHPADVLQPGDHCVHLNRAAHAAEAMRVEGTTHALIVRKSAQRAAWFDAPSTDGMAQVLHISDAAMRSRRAWWRQWLTETGKSPTTGFLAWHLATEAAQGLPVLLLGFAPGVDCGTPLWGGHAWQAEADAYARARACIIKPDNKQKHD